MKKTNTASSIITMRSYFAVCLMIIGGLAGLTLPVPALAGTVVNAPPPDREVCCTFDNGGDIWSDSYECAAAQSAAACCNDVADGWFYDWTVLGSREGSCETPVCCTFSDWGEVWSEPHLCDVSQTPNECCVDVGDGYFNDWDVVGASVGMCHPQHNTDDWNVYICSRPPDMGVVPNLGAAILGANHQWIMLQGPNGQHIETGLGPADGTIPGQAGGYQYTYPGIAPQTAWIDHAGQASASNSTCYELNSCDISTIVYGAQIGTPMGPFFGVTYDGMMPEINHCNQAVYDVLTAAGCQDWCVRYETGTYSDPGLGPGISYTYCAEWAIASGYGW